MASDHHSGTEAGEGESLRIAGHGSRGVVEGVGVQAEGSDSRRLHPVYGYLTGVQKRDRILGAFLRGCNGKARDVSNSVIVGTTVIWGFGGEYEDKLVRCWKEDRPFLHLDHAYFKRGYEHGNFRVNFRHIHQTRLIHGLPANRAEPWRKRLQPWKKDGKFVVVIVPSNSVAGVIKRAFGGEANAESWQKEASRVVRKYTDRPIYIKHKGEGLAGVLEKAWAVVSLSSVAEVEAVMAGVPVFTSPHSPANQVGLQDLSKIEEPIYPEREDWLRTLSYSQFNKEEMASGKAWGVLKELYGDLYVR